MMQLQRTTHLIDIEFSIKCSNESSQNSTRFQKCCFDSTFFVCLSDLIPSRLWWEGLGHVDRSQRQKLKICSLGNKKEACSNFTFYSFPSFVIVCPICPLSVYLLSLFFCVPACIVVYPVPTLSHLASFFSLLLPLKFPRTVAILFLKIKSCFLFLSLSSWIHL